MRRSRYKSPDDHDWRDPECPVIGKSGNAIDHRKMEIKAAMAMDSGREPTYRNDPTYNLRKAKHGRTIDK